MALLTAPRRIKSESLVPAPRTLETLKEDEAWGKIPLVALSSYGSPRLIEQTRNAGFVSHVGKFDRKGLMDTLEECCKKWSCAA